ACYGFLSLWIRNTKVSENADMAKTWATKCCPGTYKNNYQLCCGIKDDVLSIKAKLQMEWSAEQRKLPMDELKLQSYATKVADSCYEYVLDILQVTRPVVEELSKKYKLVLVSNFYGNIQTILKDFGLLDFFDEIIESSVVGVRKPDPAIYRLGVDAMGFVAKNVLVVGDSFSKDVVPAKAVGCRVAWLKGEGWGGEVIDESVPDVIITNLAQLPVLL
ncbi:HAD family hydrolase, partial [Phocaeicola sp.]|uniref:HAD family hydrolase n=1 Tax=Phocaeicola sp. TaxID=2773926 RepID=UPI003A912FCC